jgi:hypothetical protein
MKYPQITNNFTERKFIKLFMKTIQTLRFILLTLTFGCFKGSVVFGGGNDDPGNPPIKP